MQLPTGVYAMQRLEGWAQKSGDNAASPQNGGGRAAEYRVMDVDVTLQEYFQASFTDTIKEPLNLPILSLPVYLRKDKLESLLNWRDWMTLKGFLEPQGLMPFVVFKNEPKAIHGKVYYLCDIRVGWIE